MRSFGVCAWASFALGLSVAFAADVEEISFDVAMPAKVAPKIDGALDDACWKDALPHTTYYEYIKPRPKLKFFGTKSMVMYDAKGIYVGVVNPDTHIKNLRQVARKNNHPGLCTDDVAELYFDPNGSGVGFYKFMVNSLGYYGTLYRMDPQNPQPKWRPDGIVSAAKIFDDRWELELFVPWKALHDRAPAKPGDLWRFNHSRFRFTEHGWGDFGASGVMASYFSANRFGYLQFSDGSRPDAQSILRMIEQRIPDYWAVGIGGKSYIHDESGTHELSKSIGETIDDLVAADKYERAMAVTNIARLADSAKPLPPHPLPLAGTYDLNPPKAFDGHSGWHTWNPKVGHYVTPHLDWGGKAIGGTARVMFIPSEPDFRTRESIEFSQRGDFDAIIYPAPFGVSSIYCDKITGGKPLPRARQFETMIKKNPEVFVLQGLYADKIPSPYRYEIMRRVHDEGAGLVLGDTSGFRGGYVPNESVLERDNAACARLAALGLNRVGAWRYGKGRIVVTGLPYKPDPWSLRWKADYESRCAKHVAAIRWAARRDGGPTVRFANAKTAEDALAEGTRFYSFSVDADSSSVDAASRRVTQDSATVSTSTRRDAASTDVVGSVRYRVRTVWNDVVLEKTAPLTAGSNVFTVNVADFADGAYWLDVMPLDAQGACGVAGTRRFTVAGPVGRLWANSSNEVIVAEGRARTIDISWERRIPQGEAWRVDVDLLDLPYRQVRRKNSYIATTWRNSIRYTFSAEPFPTKAGCLDARLVRPDGRVVARVKKPVFFPNHDFEDYSMISWGGLNDGNMPELTAPQLVERVGYNNILSEGNIPALFNARALPYSTRVCLGAGPSGTVWTTACPIPKSDRRDPKVAEWWNKYGHDLNVHKPEVKAELTRRFSKVVERSVNYGTLAWSFGDECGFGSDIGFGDAVSEGFYRDYLKKRYGTIAAYNKAHNTNLTSFAEAPHLRTGDAVKAGDWVSWLDQVVYAEHLYADTYFALADIIHKYDPKARCGAEGSPGGDLEYTLSKLLFWGPYRSIVNDELIRNIKPECLRGIWWGAYQACDRDGFAAEQWGYVLAGTLNADLWFLNGMGYGETGTLSDDSPQPFVEKMLPTWRPLSRGVGALLCRVPMRASGFAIWYSHASNHAATLSDDFPSAMSGMEAFVRFTYRHGLDCAFVTRNTLKKLADKQVVFLAGAVALDDAEVKALADFAKKGGKIYADCEPGVYDGFLAKRATPPLKGQWTLLKRGWTDDQVLKLLGAARDVTLKGLPNERLTFRVRQLGDMKLAGFATTKASCGRRVEMTFDKPKFIYECDRGFVARADRVVEEKLAVPYRLYALFDAEQKAPAVALDHAQIVPGDTVSFGTEALRPGSVYRLEVEGPDGRRVFNRERVFCADAKKTPRIAFQFPYSDACGAWKVIVRDMATGLDATLPIKIVPNTRPAPRPALAARLASGEPEVYGIVHWGLNTYTDMEWGFGDADPALLNPTNWDANQIARACAAGGLKGLVIVAKHHDGFCLWPTKTTAYNISKSPFRKGKGDYVREMADASRRAGMKFGVYVSPWDRNSAHYGTARYVELYHRQIKELLGGRYGEVFEMWFDGANGGDGWYGGAKGRRRIGDDYYRFDEVFRFVRGLQPYVCIFNEDDGADFRWPGNEQGKLDDATRATGLSFSKANYGGYLKWAQKGVHDGTTFHPCEADFPLRPGWFYHPSQDGQSKSAAYLMQRYLDTVGNGGTMNIGIAPDRTGRLEKGDVAALKGFGDLRKVFFRKEVRDAKQPFNVVVMQEDVREGERVDAWEFVADGKTLLAGESIGIKRIRVLDKPVTAKVCALKVLKSAGAPKNLRFRRYWVDPELVKLVKDATTKSGETDTAKWMNAARK